MEIPCFSQLVSGSALILICEAKPTNRFNFLADQVSVSLKKKLVESPYSRPFRKIIWARGRKMNVVRACADLGLD